MMRGFMVEAATGLVRAVVDQPDDALAPMPPGFVWVADDPADPTDPTLHAFEPVPDGALLPFVPRRIPRPPPVLDVGRARQAALWRIDQEAARLRDAIRPAALAAVDAERVRQARDAAGGAVAALGLHPLVEAAPGETFADKAAAILAAHAQAMERLAAVEAARLRAKAAVRAAATPEAIEAIQLETETR
jgi:hypothetical protein